MIGRIATRLTLKGLAAARFPEWAPVPIDAGGTVLTLHHVQPAAPAGFAPNAHLTVTPDFLDALISDLKGAGWRFVSLADLLEHGDSRAIAVTLDDGYRDNRDHALPVFRRHDVPFAIFICPGFCDATAELWWEALERILASNDEVSLPTEGAPVAPAKTRAEKGVAFGIWADWLTRGLDEVRQREAIRLLADRYGFDLTELARELVMNWNDVRAIAADPLCTIGAHTQTHPALARLSAADAIAQMRDSADRLEAELGRRPATIAFPYGYPAAAGEREAALAQEAGFAASFTTMPGYLRKGGASHGLPRVSVNGHHQTTGEMRVLTTPAFWRIRERLRRTR